MTGAAILPAGSRASAPCNLGSYSKRIFAALRRFEKHSGDKSSG
ncbi:hypothetical protein [Leisingera sp. HS039]|nr:hypothetical protein [Leisingera sp. HS039]